MKTFVIAEEPCGRWPTRQSADWEDHKMTDMTCSKERPVTKMFSLQSFQILLLSMFCFAIGCGGAPEKKFIPAANTAESALEAGLEFWKSGNPYGPVDGFDVPIDLLDSRWQKKKKLESYEILGEEKSDGPKIFLVKMKLDEDKEDKEVKYYIFGKDPLHIWREQDYKANTGS